MRQSLPKPIENGVICDKSGLSGGGTEGMRFFLCQNAWRPKLLLLGSSPSNITTKAKITFTKEETERLMSLEVKKKCFSTGAIKTLLKIIRDMPGRSHFVTTE